MTDIRLLRQTRLDLLGGSPVEERCPLTQAVKFTSTTDGVDAQLRLVTSKATAVCGRAARVLEELQIKN